MNPLLVKNYLAGGVISAYRFVKFGTDDDHVVVATNGTDGIIGATGVVASAASGDRIDVNMVGIAPVTCGDTVTRGQPLSADSVGRAVPASTNNRVGAIALNSGVVGDIIQALFGQSGQVYDMATFTADVTVSSAEILALYTTAKELVAAPGAGKALIFESATLFLDYGSAAYASLHDLQVRYTNLSGTLLATVAASSFLDATADATRFVKATTAAAIAPTENAALVLAIPTGNVTTGDSPIKVRVNYRVISTTL